MLCTYDVHNQFDREDGCCGVYRCPANLSSFDLLPTTDLSMLLFNSPFRCVKCGRYVCSAGT